MDLGLSTSPEIVFTLFDFFVKEILVGKSLILVD